MRIEVAQSDATDFSVIYIFLQYLPRFLDMSFHGPMYQHQIKVFQSEVGKAFVKRLPNRSISHFCCVYFCCYKKFSAVNTAPAYAFAHLFLVSVALCRVDQAEPDLDCMAYSFCGIILDQERADSQLRHFHAVVQFDRWYCIHFLCTCLACHTPCKA